MGDVRISGSSNPATPAQTEVNGAESASASAAAGQTKDVASEKQQAAETGAAFKQQAGERIGQNNIRGMLLRQGLDAALTSRPPKYNTQGSSSGAPGTFNTPAPAKGGAPQPGKTGGPSAGSRVTLAERNEEHATRGLQTSLNRWRAAMGQPLLEVNGNLDENTKKAIKQFQHDGGLKEDGIMGPSTRGRLSLLTDIQKRIGNESGPRLNLELILGSSGFRNMSEPLQTEILHRIRYYAGSKNLLTRDNIGRMESIIVDSSFDRLQDGGKKAILDSLAMHPGGKHMEELLRYQRDFAFQSLSPDNQREVIDRMQSYPKDPDQLNNLTTLLGFPGFGNISGDVRDQILNRLPRSFATDQLSIAQMRNIMNLITEQHFDQLPERVRGTMLDAMLARPDNTQLAAALRQLSADPIFRHDRRNQENSIYQVNDSI